MGYNLVNGKIHWVSSLVKQWSWNDVSRNENDLTT